jgi:Tol biopolymer transport system component
VNPGQELERHGAQPATRRLRRLEPRLRAIAGLLAIAAAAGFLSGGGGPAVAAGISARGLTEDVDVVGEGLVSLSQTDFRWGSFLLGPQPTETDTFERCGCYLSTLASVIRFYLGEPGQAGGSVPWFAHDVRDFRSPPTFLTKVLSWTPAYLDRFLVHGPDPDHPSPLGWGYSKASDGVCGANVWPWALSEVADPVRDPTTSRPQTPTGVSIREYTGWHPEVVDRNLHVLDPNLKTHKPTIVVVQKGTALHAQLIVGWINDPGMYLVVDPGSPTGSGGAQGGLFDLGDYSERERYDRWIASIQVTIDVQPQFESTRWLWVEDDPEPIELMSIDPSGRREGVDPATGKAVHEDPRAFSETFSSWADPLGQLPAADPTRSIFVEDPVAGTYGFEVLGTGAGPFTLRFGTTVGDEATVAQTVTGTISKGQVLRYEVAYTPGGGASVRQVERFAPQALAGNDVSTFVSLPVHFDGSGSYDVGGSIAAHSWDFGDGSSATGPAVTHAYSTPGAYIARLTIKSANGLTASDTRTVKVFGGSSKTTVRASVRADGRELVTTSLKPAISADGRYLAFESSGDLTNDGTSGPAIFVKDLSSGSVERIGGLGSESGRPAISADGRFVAFIARNVVPGDLNYRTDVLVRDRTTGTTKSVASWVDPAAEGGGQPAISADGRFVAFASRSQSLVPGDTNLIADVFVHDRATGATERVSLTSTGAENPPGAGLTGGASEPAISADGRYVAFTSDSPHFVPDDSNVWHDVFVRDRAQQTTERVSLSDGGQQLDSWSRSPAISADGRLVAFTSQARGVTADAPSDWENVFVRDRQSARTELVSVSTRGVSGDAQSSTPAISRDGRYVSFWSLADDLVPGDTNRQPGGETPQGADVFVRDLEQRTTDRISVSTSGEQALPNGVGGFKTSAIADDGTVAFDADAANLVPDDSNSWADVFVRSGARAQGAGPLASLSGPYVGWASSQIRFDASGSIGQGAGPLAATWDFGDASPVVSAGVQITHVYREPGKYIVRVTVGDGSRTSEPATTSVEVLPALGAESLAVTPTCGGAGTALTIVGLARGANAALVDGGWDLSKGALRPLDVELVLPWATVPATPIPATFLFERTVVVPAALASGSHRIQVAGGSEATFTIPCPAPGNRRPLADAGGPYNGSAGRPLTLDGSGSRDPEGSALTYRWDFGDGTTGSGIRPTHVYQAGGVYLLSLVVNDGHADSAHGVGTHAYALAVISADDVAPVTEAVASPRPNAAGWNNGDVAVGLSTRDNEGGSGVKEIVYATAGAQITGDTVVGATAHVTITAEGETTLSYFARDNAGNAGEPRKLTVRIDRTAPSIECSANPSLLWPPNHRLVPIDVHVAVNDALSAPGGFELVALTSSEPDNGLGDGDTPVDIQGFTTGTPDTTGSLRAERAGTGPGRVYSWSTKHVTSPGTSAAAPPASPSPTTRPDR